MRTQGQFVKLQTSITYAEVIDTKLPIRVRPAHFLNLQHTVSILLTALGPVA